MTVHRESTLPILRFLPILKDKIWGGSNLSGLLGVQHPEGRLGEAWLVSGYGADTSALSTPIGSARTLTDILDNDPVGLMGQQIDGRIFPLLYKFIDAADKLSVQVHPDDRSAIVNRWGKLGKTECWYILEARPGAELIIGFNDNYDIQTIADAVLNNTLESLLNKVPVVKGDVLFIPAGTVHAILDGITIYEVQESSDTTFRLYDWGRTDTSGVPRPLHIAESLSVLQNSDPGQQPIEPLSIFCGEGAVRKFRCACRFFSLEEFSLPAETEIALPRKSSFSVVTVLSGSITLGEGAHRVTLSAGQTGLIPAAINHGIRASTSKAPAEFLLSCVPDLSSEVISPLRAAGCPVGQIARLGGINPTRNDLLPLL